MRTSGRANQASLKGLPQQTDKGLDNFDMCIVLVNTHKRKHVLGPTFINFSIAVITNVNVLGVPPIHRVVAI